MVCGPCGAQSSMIERLVLGFYYHAEAVITTQRSGISSPVDRRTFPSSPRPPCTDQQKDMDCSSDVLPRLSLPLPPPSLSTMSSWMTYEVL